MHKRSTEWSFLTNHALAVLHIARDPDARLRDIARGLDVTEGTALHVVTDLTNHGYLTREPNPHDARRNRYRLQTNIRLRDPIIAHHTIADLLGVFDAPAVRAGSHSQHASVRDER